MTETTEKLSPTVVAPEVEFDHHSLEYANAWPEITRDMRSKCPVSHSSAWEGFYAVTSFEALADVIRDDATFSSARSVPGVDPGRAIGIMIPPTPVGTVPIDLDPPHNRPYRRLLDPLFSPKASAAWEPFIRESVTACIDTFIEAGQGDLVLDVANPVPGLLTCKLMGLPLADWRYYAEPMHEVVYTLPDTPEMDAVQAKVLVMFGKIFEAVEARRTDPQDDLISRLLAAEIDGAPIPDNILIEILFLVLIGGVDTTTSLIANALRWLADHPDERDRLREDPSLMPKAREEMLRYFTPTQGLARTVTRDTDVAGVPMTVGDRIFMSFAAANRDPAVFPDPDALLLERTPNTHTSFGLGVHRCLGSNIARLEFDIVVQEVLRRMPDYVIDEAGSKRYQTGGVVNGWERMPCTFTPGSKVGGTSLKL
jgi:cytochrome P450